jgi:hypothetical protein
VGVQDQVASAGSAGALGLVTLARSDRGWLVKVIDLPVHHPR